MFFLTFHSIFQRRVHIQFHPLVARSAIVAEVMKNSDNGVKVFEVLVVNEAADKEVMAQPVHIGELCVP